MRLVCAAMMAAMILGLSSMPSMAAEKSTNAFLARLMGQLYREGETFACFSRQYDDADLAKHPRQNVVFAKLLVSAHFSASAMDSERGSYNYQLGMAFRFRGRSELLTTVAECGDGKRRDSLRDGAVCAGPKADGHSHLLLARDGSLLLAFPDGADLWAPGPIDQRHDVVKNPFGSDDRVFRLDRADLSQCEDLAFDRQKPLRAHEP